MNSPTPWLQVAVAMAVCAAPGAGQWVEDPGKGWIALAVYRQDTKTQYGLDGGSREFFSDGHAVTTSSFLTLDLGLVNGIDAWGQLSFHNLSFDDLAGSRARTGFGDMRFWIRAAPLKWLGSGLPFTIRSGVKLPVGDFNVDAEVIPLGDGQRDWEVMAELGHSFYPRSVYVMGWLGYRWREGNTTSRKDFGNERFYWAQVGGRVGPLGYKAALDGWDGEPGVVEGILVPSFQRDLVQLQTTLLYPAGPGEVELGARFTLAGKNLPAGTALLVQYFTRISPF